MEGPEKNDGTISSLMSAIVQDDFENFKKLFNSPKFYHATDKWGFSVLQNAIFADNKRVFDFLLSIPHYPLDYVNREGETALAAALSTYLADDASLREYFALELIKKGANINIGCKQNNTLLHRAIKKSYLSVAKLLIEKGVDLNCVNKNGCTPLDLALGLDEDIVEMVSMLLVNGADVNSVESFEYAVKYGLPESIQEMLFLYFFDEDVEVDLEFETVLKLAKTNNFVFREIIKCNIRVEIAEDDFFMCFNFFNAMSTDNLRLILKKYSDCVHKIFANYVGLVEYNTDCIETMNIENLNVLLETHFKAEVIEFIATTDFEPMFHFYTEFLNLQFIENLYCCLLSYGLQLTETDLQLIYKNYGYCRLFKVFLFMDYTMTTSENCIKNIMPRVIYDVTMDQILENISSFSSDSLKELLFYFCHQRVIDECLRIGYHEGALSGLPKVPLLVELARNEFRKHFVNVFNIGTSAKFYTLLQQLPISRVYTKIISFETKLYKIDF